MPARIKLVRQRVALAKMVLRCVQLVAVEYLGTAAYGSAADDVVLLCAIFVAQAERRPLTAAKLADFAGMPRATVARKLREFSARGLVEIVGGKAMLPVDRLNHDGVVAMIEAASRSVLRTSTELSKMDTKAVARGDVA